MSGPLAGIGQQQIPLSQPFQPGGNDQSKVVRSQEQSPEREEIQVRGSALGNTNETETNTNDNVLQKGQTLFTSDSQESSSDTPRGSLVNITV